MKLLDLFIKFANLLFINLLKEQFNIKMLKQELIYIDKVLN